MKTRQGKDELNGATIKQSSSKKGFAFFVLVGSGRALFLSFLLLFYFFTAFAYAEAQNWKITAYCACIKCCGKSDAITASGHKAQYGYVACNWLPFGTRVRIAGLGEFIVMDRGAKSLFGSKNNHIKHLDIYMATHRQALKFGVRYAKVEVLE